MRRKDREISDMKKIVDEVIDKADVIRIGLADGDYPYIVPLNYAYTFEDDHLEFYVHGAAAGRKMDLLRKNPVCSFEIDTDHQPVFIPEKGYATMNYKSAMGRGKIEEIEDEHEKEKMLVEIVRRYNPPEGFRFDRRSLPVTEVMKITVTSITGKANRKKV
ncbi:MAG: pyridoxamine 5'-phosphate oxidase family protein [Anaerovoracaceae bacterium]|jgi:nitroimidazol reductase NimA-like FMN-containing flavoprotein (pyridoxamine 5'-phosphate oxidase superfamily)